MKKILLLILLSGLLYQSCHTDTGKTDEKVIVTSFYPIYIMTLNVTKDVEGVRVVNMAPPSAGCLHDYQLTPADLKVIESADIFVINGGGAESFLDKVRSLYASLTIVDSSLHITPLPAMEDEDEHGHDHAHDHQVNEHFWLSVALYRVQVQNIAEQLAAADGEHASAYLANAARYDKELAALEADLHAELDRYSGRKIITFHDAFPYFARDYNFEVVATITNDPNTEISPQHIKRLVDIIKATPDIILFTEKEYPSPVAEVLERETGVKSYMIDSAVSGNNALNSYIEAMRSNGKIVSEAMAAGTAQ